MVTPSELASFIDLAFPAAKPSAARQPFELGRNYASTVAAIAEMAEDLVRSHFTHSAKDYIEFRAALAALKTAVRQWQSGEHAYGVGRVHMNDDRNAVVVMRDTLERCADSVPLASEREFDFVADEDLRVDLQRDMETARRALNSGEWKTATVFAGVTMETLLLAGLQRLAAVDASKFAKAQEVDQRPIERWTLEQLLSAAEKVGLLTETTLNNARTVQQFRNFIHPGKAQRLQQKCDRGTSFIAVGTVDRVARDVKTVFA